MERDACSEGPTTLVRQATTARERDGFDATFTTEDIWYTSKGSTVYAIGLTHPPGTITLRSLRAVRVHEVRMLSSDQTLAWIQTPDGLRVTLAAPASDIGYALAIEVVE